MSDSTLETALITGASSGIGATYADRLARRGYDLILVARNKQRLDALAEKLRAETGRTIEVLVADLTDGDDLSRIEKLLATDSLISLFLNNAGAALKGGILDNETPAFEKLIALNVTATTVLASAAAKAFKARGSGSIINIASVLALAPELFDGTYSATKAFNLHLSRSLSTLLADSGVYVQAVLPGATRTEIWENSGTPVEALPIEMVMEVDDLVDAALIGFDRRENVTIPPLEDEGQWLAFDQARGALLPNLSRNVVASRYRAEVDA